MSDNWIHKGSAEGLGSLIPGPSKEWVVNTETGEEGVVYVGKNQTVGEAIAKGQWHEPPHKR